MNVFVGIGFAGAKFVHSEYDAIPSVYRTFVQCHGGVFTDNAVWFESVLQLKFFQSFEHGGGVFAFFQIAFGNKCFCRQSDGFGRVDFLGFYLIRCRVHGVGVDEFNQAFTKHVVGGVVGAKVQELFAQVVCWFHQGEFA